MKGLRTIRITSSSAALVAAVGYATTAAAAPLVLSDSPLFLGGNVEPNLVFNQDDSGSMQFEYMPGEGFHDVSRFLFPRPSSPYGGSTYTNYVPNFFDKNLHNFYMRSAHNNAVFYNPNITYQPWVNPDGSDMANADPVAAYYNPRLTGQGTLNLTVQQTQTAEWFSYCGPNSSGTCANTGVYTAANINSAFCQAASATTYPGGSCTTSHTYWPITYYNYNGTGSKYAASSYTKVQITSSTPSTATFTYTDPQDGIQKTRTRDEEIQNFANWFQYHRSRILTARAGTGRAFGEQGPGMRVGFAAINKGSKDIDGVTSPGAMRRGVRPFSGGARTNFFDKLYDEVIDAEGTPLRRAMDDVGKYFERSDDRGPWGADPASTTDSTPHLECRQSYQILMTDGYWNGDDAPTAAARANVDNTAGTTITNTPLLPSKSYTYTPAAPYKDSYGHPNPDGGTLADVAMYYWKRDLRPDLVNDVTTNPLDPAFWQHLVTFTVGLGVSGTLDPATDLPALTSGAKQWPNPVPDPNDPDSQNAEKTDDLWHTAVNGHGQFFSAADPVTFANALSDALSAIKDRNGSAASVALNSGSITSNARLYQARFDSGDWSGQLVAYALHDGVSNTYGCTASDPIGKVCPTPVWDAGEVIDTQNWDTDRKIVTYKPSIDDGIPFRWPANPSSPTSTELDLSQVNDLKTHPTSGALDTRGQDRLEYLRGRIVTGFRNRSSVLGDIVHSAPVYVGAPAFSYPDNWGGGAPETAYSTFRSAQQNREPMLYVSANDGMLHAFAASSGQDRFAYVPSAVFPNLSKLTSRFYSHRYYVDGSPTAVDAFVNSQWRTILASGLRGGGRGVYALDVTTAPSSSESEATAASRVLWEYNHTDNGGTDLGYTFGEVNIVRMKNGTWAAVFGNGYNSDNGRAVLYIVDLDDGSLIRAIDTLAGSTSTPNGLAAPAPVDINGDFIVDYIYAGDLLGNLWKFDVTSTNTSSWDVAYGAPLFQARTASNQVQPITVRPQVGVHPTGQPQTAGVMVYFGTGKYIETTDNTPVSQNTQTFYGVWDKNQASLTAFTRSHLVEQQITHEETVQGFQVRVTSANPINWHTASGTPSGSPPTSHLGWYLDLLNTEGGNTNNFGERQVTNPLLRNGRIIFTTLVPTEIVNACDFGGDGWLMELDATSGSRLAFSPFDLDNNSKFDEGDYATIYDASGNPLKVPASGKKSTVGIIPTPGIVAGVEPIEYKFTSGSTGMIETTRENAGAEDLGRQTWRQLR